MGFIVGSHIQHTKTGYHFDIRDETTYDSPIGRLSWRYVTESVGLPILDPGTTILEFEGRRIYSARRAFQEYAPYARDIRIDGNRVEWQDGDYQYGLEIT